jgi:hypothetical protein
MRMIAQHGLCIGQRLARLKANARGNGAQPRADRVIRPGGSRGGGGGWQGGILGRESRRTLT